MFETSVSYYIFCSYYTYLYIYFIKSILLEINENIRDIDHSDYFNTGYVLIWYLSKFNSNDR